MGDGSVLVIDMGATNFRMGLFDESDSSLSSVVIYDTPQNWSCEEDVLGGIADHVMRYCQLSNLVPTRIGLSVPGSVDKIRGCFKARNLSYNRKVHIREYLASAFECQVNLVNDANAGVLAVSELEYKSSNLMYITLSTGVGSGAIVDGRLIDGSEGRANNIGRFMVHALGVEYSWEECVSGKNITQFYKDWCKVNNISALDVGSSEELFMELLSAPEQKEKFLAFVHSVNRRVLASIISMTAPEVIYFGGSVAVKNQKELIDPLMNDPLFKSHPYKCAINVTHLGDEISLLGAGIAANIIEC